MSLQLFTPQSIQLRNYQQALIQGILEAWKQDKRLGHSVERGRKISLRV